MAVILQFSNHQVQPQHLLRVHEEGITYTLEDMTKFDYRGTWEAIRQHRPELLSKLSTTTFKPLSLAQGALIARSLKRDNKSAEILATEFSKIVVNGKTSEMLLTLPDFTRGYVWSYNLHLLYRARAEVEHYYTY